MEASWRVGALALCAVLGACGSPPEPGGPPAAAERVTETPPIVARFDCDTLALTATFHEERVTLALPDRSITLPQAASASGARFTEGSITFWNKGREATLEIGGRREMCRERQDPWQDARDRGIDFRAIGQEPGWFLEIDKEKQMRLVYDYAEHEAQTPVPAPTVGSGTMTYESASQAHRLRVVIDERPCNDVMSGDLFPRTVVLTINGRTLHGCGRDLTGAGGP